MQALGNAQRIRDYASFVQEQYCTVAARALFLWDYFITIDGEIEYIWTRKFTVASGLFVVNRYLNLLITILELVEQAPFQTAQRYEQTTQTGAQLCLLDMHSCPSVVRVLQFSLVLSNLATASFVTLRVYATWSLDWRPSLPVLLLALVSPAANVYLNIKSSVIPAPKPSVGCALNTNIDHVLYSKSALPRAGHFTICSHEIVVIVQRATTTICDLLILVLTFVKTTEVRKMALGFDSNPSLMVLLLRDGTFYFLLLLAVNLSQIIIAAEVPGNNDVQFFVYPLTSMLISRFLLNLRRVAQLPYVSTCETGSQVSRGVISTAFSGGSMEALGNLGAPLYSALDPDATEVSHGDFKLLDESFLFTRTPSVLEMKGHDIELEELA